MASSEFQPKNILLTGGAGFIGSHVTILFATKYPHYKVVFVFVIGCQPVITSFLFTQIVVVDKLDYCANLNNLKSIVNLPNFKFVQGDVMSVRQR